ncbi:MAG: class I SAM-dependent methyltransferase [Flavobacterium sp.]
MKRIQVFEGRAAFAKAMITKYQSNFPNSKVSDIGSGWGNMKTIIEGAGLKWFPFDYVNKIDESIIWDLNDPCPIENHKVGAVIFLEVLEHLSNPLLGIQNIANQMERGGILILTTPNPASSRNTIHFLLKGTLFAFQKKHLKEHHVFTPWRHIVEFFLINQGFEIMEYAGVDYNYTKNQKRNWKEYLKRVIEKIVEYRNPLSKGMSYGIVAKKIID